MSQQLEFVPTEDPDRALVEQSLSAHPGDLRAFEKLVSKYQRSVLANCRHLTLGHDSADDLAQEVFVKVYFGLRSYQGRSSFRSWVQSIKVKHCLTYLKKESKRKFVAVEDEQVQQAAQLSAPPEVERLIHQESNRETVSFVLAQMSETLRVPLILCDMDEMSYEDIADHLNIGLSAVKMRIVRARQDFRERYRMLLEQRPTAGAAYA